MKEIRILQEPYRTIKTNMAVDELIRANARIIVVRKEDQMARKLLLASG